MRGNILKREKKYDGNQQDGEIRKSGEGAIPILGRQKYSYRSKVSIFLKYSDPNLAKWGGDLEYDNKKRKQNSSSRYESAAVDSGKDQEGKDKKRNN